VTWWCWGTGGNLSYRERDKICSRSAVRTSSAREVRGCGHHWCPVSPRWQVVGKHHDFLNQVVGGLVVTALAPTRWHSRSRSSGRGREQLDRTSRCHEGLRRRSVSSGNLDKVLKNKLAGDGRRTTPRLDPIGRFPRGKHPPHERKRSGPTITERVVNSGLFTGRLPRTTLGPAAVAKRALDGRHTYCNARYFD